MALHPIAAGLRRFVNDSTEITRVDVRVGPGAEIAVDELVAAQLGPRFKDPDEVAARDAERAALLPDDSPAKANRARKSKTDAAPVDPADPVEVDDAAVDEG